MCVLSWLPFDLLQALVYGTGLCSARVGSYEAVTPNGNCSAQLCWWLQLFVNVVCLLHQGHVQMLVHTTGKSVLVLYTPWEGTDAWTATCASRNGSPYASSKQRRKCGCIVAGHSLGGALATLAAYDIRKQLLNNQQGNVRVICYTFAAPRTGNHAFARDYNAMVPDTWSIINDQVSNSKMPFNTYAVLAVVTCITCCGEQQNSQCHECSLHSVGKSVHAPCML